MIIGNVGYFNFSYFIYARLFVMMGIIWFLEAISFATGDTVSFIIAILNTSQGVVIFTLFVMRRRVFDLIKDRLVLIIIIITRQMDISYDHDTIHTWSRTVAIFNEYDCYLLHQRGIKAHLLQKNDRQLRETPIFIYLIISHNKNLMTV